MHCLSQTRNVVSTPTNPTVSMALAELVHKAEQNGDVDFLRAGVRVLSQALMEVEVSQHLGAERHERTAERSVQRNGYREREWDTRVGTIELRVPRVRDGGYFSAVLEPRPRSEQALVAVLDVTAGSVSQRMSAAGLIGLVSRARTDDCKALAQLESLNQGA
jgi:putative transposase